MSPQQEITELDKSSELGASSSRKRDRHDDNSHTEGPSKRPRMPVDNEPPTRKDTPTTPKTKQKKTRKKINNHKASRTSNHHELKEANRTLLCQVWDAEKALRDMKKKLADTEQKLEDTEKDRQSKIAELESTRKINDAKSEELAGQNLAIITDRQELQSLKASVGDPVNGIQALQDACKEKDAKLKEKDEIIATQQKEADAYRMVIDKNGDWNTKISNKEQRAKDTLKVERNERKKVVLALEAEKFDLEQHCADLKTELTTKANEYTGMIARLQLDLQASRPQSHRFNFKVPDEKVKQDFTNLASNIRQFVDKYTRPVLNATDQELKTVWPSCSNQLKEFVASRLLSCLLFEGYVWECLLARVFAPWSEVWAGEVGQSMEKALCIAGGEIERAGFGSDLYVDYQYWRSSSSSFIGRLAGEDFGLESFESAVEAMTMSIGNLCGSGVSCEMKADATSIFKDARDFEIQRRKLKAAYQFRMCKSFPGGGKLKYGMYFDDEGMIDRSPKPTGKNNGDILKVDFIISPGLHKRGSNDGERYENHTWLIKRGVVCNAARFISRPSSFTTARQALSQAREPRRPGENEQQNEGQVPALHHQTGSSANGDKDGLIEINDYDLGLFPTSSPTNGSLSPRLHDSAQMQLSTAMNMVTRSQASLKTNTSVDDGKPSTR